MFHYLYFLNKLNEHPNQFFIRLKGSIRISVIEFYDEFEYGNGCPFAEPTQPQNKHQHQKTIITR